MNQNEMTKMEFLLTLNENIVVQRFYNVRGYNLNFGTRDMVLIMTKFMISQKDFKSI